MKPQAAVQKQSKNCTQCASSNTVTISKGRYFFMTALLPLLVLLAIVVFVSSVFYLFIPALLATNYIIAAKKAPFLICKSCSSIDKTWSSAAKT